MNSLPPTNPWQKFQPQANLNRRRRRRRLSLLTIFFCLLFIGIAIWGTGGLLPAIRHEFTEMVTFFRQSASPPEPVAPAPPQPLTREQVKDLISQLLMTNPVPGAITGSREDQSLTIETGLNPRLQQSLLDEISHLKTLTRAKPEIIAMVVMAPDNGQILAMAGFDATAPGINPCISHKYPAASLFKIITAAAVVEQGLMGPNTPLFFNGGKYTLYKRQLKKVRNRYTTTTTLEKAFSQSINPIFGKLGAHDLGGEQLKTHALKFGFNQPMPTEFNADSGAITVTDRPYQWAEVASGFNKTTTISPLFGAMITATLLNHGTLPVPYLVETITTEQGQTIYHRPPPEIRRAVTEKTADTVMKMMTHTITTGTAKKAFRHYRRDKVLTRLILGGKTGSLYNGDHTIKLDWFTGFAREKKGTEQIVVSVLVGHGQYIGTKAGTFARQIFKEYFSDYFTSRLE